MSYQDPIYNQNSSFLKNETIPVTRTSSDLCIFESPTYSMVGADKVDFSGVTSTSCDISTPINGLTFDEIYTATTECYINEGYGGPCMSAVTWNVQVYEDDALVVNEGFYQSVSGESITISEWAEAVEKMMYYLDYDYTLTGTTLEIQQVFGVNNIKINLMTDIDSSTCISASSTPDTCGPTNTLFCDMYFTGLTNNDQNVYEIEDESTIGLEFMFTDLDATSIANTNTRFKYEIYKYNHTTKIFLEPAVHQSSSISLNGVTGLTDTVSVSSLSIDGDYIVKGYYEFDNCTEFGKLLDLSYSTIETKLSTNYGIYDEVSDYYFVAFKSSDIPLFIAGNPLVESFGNLKVVSALLDGTTNTFTLPNNQGNIGISLNGLALANTLDYVILTPVEGSNILKLSGDTFSGDVLTYIYTNTNTANNITIEVIEVDTPTVSGATDGEGTNLVYYNTGTTMFELFTKYTPVNNNDIMVTINGVTLANKIDYYSSISNPKRIILTGNVFLNDIINIYYNTSIDVSGEIFKDSVEINWSIENQPQNGSGEFIVELSTDNTFSNIVNSVTTNYIKGVSNYKVILGLVGSFGDVLYYRVRNVKKYININGFPIISEKNSEIIEITMQTNISNSY